MQYAPLTFVWVKCEDGIWWPARIPEGVLEAEIRAIEPDKDTCVEFFHHTGAYYTVSSLDVDTIQLLHFTQEDQSPSERQRFLNPVVQAAVKKAFAARFLSSSLPMNGKESTATFTTRLLKDEKALKHPESNEKPSMHCSEVNRGEEERMASNMSRKKVMKEVTTKDYLSSSTSQFTSEEKNHILELMRAIHPNTIKAAFQSMPSSSLLSAPPEGGVERSYCGEQNSPRLASASFSSLPSFSSLDSNAPKDSTTTFSPSLATQTTNATLPLHKTVQASRNSQHTEFSGAPVLRSSFTPSSSLLLSRPSCSSSRVRAKRSPHSHRLCCERCDDETRMKDKEADETPQLLRAIDYSDEDSATCFAAHSTTETSSLLKKYVPPVSLAVLQVIRSTVFEDPSRFVLSPLYSLLDILGAVHISSESVRTNFPTPYAARQVLKEFSDTQDKSGWLTSTRRVLLLPLKCLENGSYDHQMGWMQPTLLDDIVLEMRIRVNGSKVSTPCNWNIAAAKEKNAVKTSPVLDITSLVMTSSAELNLQQKNYLSKGETQEIISKDELAVEEDDIFTLEVQFPELPNGTEEDSLILWDGLIVALYVDTIPLREIENRIISCYRRPLAEQPPLLSVSTAAGFLSSGRTSDGEKRENEDDCPKRQRKRRKITKSHEVDMNSSSSDNTADTVVPIHVVRGTMSVHCPLIRTPMTTPVRGIYCEHLQCIELSAALVQFTRSNIWNCPLCGEDMRPSAILVHHRFRWWLSQHSSSELQRIEYVEENEDNTLTPHYKCLHVTSSDNVHLIE